MRATPHYYGDRIRKLFISGGLIMLITLPFLKDEISSPIFYSVLVILFLTFFAGMTNPRQKAIMVGDVIVSILSFGVFAYEAVVEFHGFLDLFFITNFVLAILFLFAFYWSVKTARWFEDPEKIPVEHPPFEPKKEEIIDAKEDTIVPHPKKELTPEERRKKRFLGDEE